MDSIEKKMAPVIHLRHGLNVSPILSPHLLRMASQIFCTHFGQRLLRHLAPSFRKQLTVSVQLSITYYVFCSYSENMLIL